MVSKSNKMKEVILNIPDMQSTHCQTRVNQAVKEIADVQVQHLEAGKLTVSLASDDTKDEVVKAIEKAGYNVSSADEKSTSDCSTGCCSK